MGFLGEMGKQLGGQPDIMQIVQTLMTQSGGLDGLLAKLQQGGLGDIVQSWMGNGPNLPVSAEQITQALGNPQLAALA